MPTISSVTVTQQTAPTPSVLQKTGALISQGGTTGSAGSRTLLTSAADITALLVAAITLSSLTQSSGVATATLKSTTISAGSYNSTTGLVTLTLTATLSVPVGARVKISSATGTGSFASLNGVQTTAVGTTGVTLTFYLATGLTMTISGGTIVATTGLDVAATFWTTIAGATPTAYNGRVLATVASDTTFTFSIASGTASPATGTITCTAPGVNELQQMVETFFDQGTQQGVYVLELGPGTPAAGVTALGSYITLNPNVFYSYLTPRSWAGESTFVTFLAGYVATTSKTYFFVTATTSNYTSFAGLKCVVLLVESTAVANTEFQLAAVFRVTLNYTPSSTTKVTPLSFAYLFGVTAYPQAGNATLFATLKAAGVNFVGSGPEGQVSAEVLYWGTTMDGRPFTYWYSVDWLQINVPLSVDAAVVNGSNDPTNPLYYNQDGIDRLQAVAASVLGRAITYGLALGSVLQTGLSQTEFNANLGSGVYAGILVINAIPFVPYNVENPSDYADGLYSGYTVVYITQNGFINIIFNVVVTDFVAT